jgi:hypothetical protein
MPPPPGKRTPQEADLVRAVAAAATRTVKAAGPRLTIERHWGTSWFVGTDLVCAVFEHSRHLGVEFWRGTTLRDPAALLEGTGKNLRHVKLSPMAEASSTAFRELVRDAVRLDRESEKRPR